MAQNEKLLYTAQVHTTGGRENGVARSSDGHLDVRLSVPGTAGAGTNPEQLFAAGWSACFEGAMSVVARKMNITLPADTSIDAKVELLLTDGEYSIRGRLNVNLPGLDQETAQKLVDVSHQTCPYSKATRGNIDAEINVITAPAQRAGGV